MKMGRGAASPLLPGVEDGDVSRPRRRGAKFLVVAVAGVCASALFIAAVGSPWSGERGVVLMREAGIGTFPGGQSTGGYSEFDFEVRIQPIVIISVANACQACWSVASGLSLIIPFPPLALHSSPPPPPLPPPPWPPSRSRGEPLGF